MSRMDPHRRDLLLTAGAALAAVSAPALAQPASGLSFVALGDWGQRGSRTQVEVARQMARTAAQTDARFVMTVGDNFYDKGVASTSDRHWRDSFENVYSAPSLQVPWYPVLGNHDYKGEDANPDAQVAYSAINPRWRMPARHYVQPIILPDGRTLDMFAFDTTLHLTPREHERPLRLAQMVWLDKALRTSTAEWKLVFGHHAIFSNGSLHGSSRPLIAWLKPQLEAHGVQAYVCGHDHDLQHIVSGPVNYIVTGGGSDFRRVRDRDDWVAGTRFAMGAPGFTAFQVKDDTLAVRWIDRAGADVWKTEIARKPARAMAAAA